MTEAQWHNVWLKAQPWAKRSTITVLAMLLAVSGFLLGSSPATGADTGLSRLDLARTELANCQLLLQVATGSSQRNRANNCIADQTAIIKALTATPTTSPSPTASPSSSPSSSPSPTVTTPAPTTPAPTTPAPTTPAPTTPPPTGLLTNCFTQLAACGYPTLQSTGVAAGVTLTPSGTIFARTAGQVIQNMDVSGCIVVEAPGVIIINTRVRVPDNCLDGIRTYDAKGGTTTITQVEITCSFAHGSALAGPRFKALRVQLRGCENGSEINEGSSIIDSWIEGSEVGNDNAHGDDIQSQGGNNVVIRHNTFAGLNPITASIITNPTGNSHWLIEDNLVSAGAYTLYCPEDPAQGDFIVRNNRFYPYKTMAGVELYKTLGDKHAPAFGLTDACTDSRITWTGNYRDDNLRTVTSSGATV
jgi:hypothetical protein